MPTRMLTVLGAGALVLVVALGAWGWTDHEASAERHAAALRAGNQEEFCLFLDQTITQVSGQSAEIPFVLPGSEPSDDVLKINAEYVQYLVETQLVRDAPPALLHDVERLGEASAEVSATGSVEPLRSGPVQRSLVQLAEYWRNNCN